MEGGTYAVLFNLVPSGRGKFFCRKWILKNCIEAQEKEKKTIVLCLSPPQKRQFSRQFYVVVVQRRQRSAQKSSCKVDVLPIYS